MDKLSTKDTVVILGDSPFLTIIETKISYVLDKFFSIGINRVINKFCTSYHICADEKIIPVANTHPMIPTVSLYRHGDMIRKDRKELIDTYSFNFSKDTERDIIKGNKLAWCGFTHDYAISYCICKGWKNVILIGAADFTEGKHYSNTDKFNPSAKLVEQSKRFIEEVCIKRINIYTCNPYSKLKVPQIDIDDLLK